MMTNSNKLIRYVITCQLGDHAHEIELATFQGYEAAIRRAEMALRMEYEDFDSTFVVLGSREIESGEIKE